MIKPFALVMFAVMLGAMPVLAAETVFKAEVKTGYCGEIDPYVIGDACIAILAVGSEAAGNLHILTMLDQTEDSENSPVGKLVRKIGKKVMIDTKQFKAIKKQKLLDALNQEVNKAARDFVLNRQEGRAKRAFVTLIK